MKEFTVSVSPHIRAPRTTQTIMRDVLIALCPALIAACITAGERALLVTAVCVAASVLFEWLYEKLMKKPVTVTDLSAAVTGMILAFNLPVGLARRVPGRNLFRRPDRRRPLPHRKKGDHLAHPRDLRRNCVRADRPARKGAGVSGAFRRASAGRHLHGNRLRHLPLYPLGQGGVWIRLRPNYRFDPRVGQLSGGRFLRHPADEYSEPLYFLVDTQ